MSIIELLIRNTECRTGSMPPLSRNFITFTHGTFRCRIDVAASGVFLAHFSEVS